ncbi:hypothetical protein [Streptomyces griseus]|uniref:hypothetical protein n=1 Tax=Streptomyces griseus TaxID=1911 RepID=UPI0033E9C915
MTHKDLVDDVAAMLDDRRQEYDTSARTSEQVARDIVRLVRSSVWAEVEAYARKKKGGARS